MTYKEILRDVRAAIRHPYAWPGGYPIYTVMDDGGLLCPKCAREEYRQIARDTREQLGGCWTALGAEILWETEQQEYCCHCETPIESAYGIIEGAE